MSMRIDDDRVEAELVGCAALAPRMLVGRSVLTEGRLKVQYGAGYEHFQLDHYAERGGAKVPVFVWVDRTWIAE